MVAAAAAAAVPLLTMMMMMTTTTTTTKVAVTVVMVAGITRKAGTAVTLTIKAIRTRQQPFLQQPPPRWPSG